MTPFMTIITVVLLLGNGFFAGASLKAHDYWGAALNLAASALLFSILLRRQQRGRR
jgi:hypothetical protein